MPRPKRRRPPVPKPAPDLTLKKLNTFLLHLGRTGSVTFAAARAGLPRRALYKHRAADEAFAGYWDEALNLGVERLQDDAMRRAWKARRARCSAMASRSAPCSSSTTACCSFC